MMNVEQRNKAILFHNKAVECSQTDKQMGYKLFCSAVDIDPSLPDAWYAIGNANGDMNLREASVAAFRRTVEVDPENVRAWVNLGHKLYHTGRHEEARCATKRALEIDPKDPYALCNLSLIQSVLDEPWEALRSAQKAHEFLPDDPTIQIQLAFAHLFVRHWAEGLKWFEARFPYRLPQYLQFPYPMWRGEDIADKTLYLVAEMGMGDTLSFMRFLPAVASRAKLVKLHVQQELLRVISAMVNREMMMMPNVEISPLGMIPEADYWCATTSMPVALGLSDRKISDAAQLHVPLAGLSAAPTWKAKDRRLHVGVCWGGSPINDIDRWRSCDVTQFLDLYRVPGIQLYSLQVGPRAVELHNAGCAALIRDLSSYIRDVMDTMTIIRDLDLVITVETAVGHIAGAIDADCWVLMAQNGGDWRCGRKGDKVLWYPRHRLFRQGEDASWQPVFDRVVRALRERVT